MQIHESELILNQDGSVYHLNLLPEDIAPTIIFVGDPDRVKEVSKHFDRIELTKQKREFVTHTGYIGKKRLSVISTGISTANIDIVVNELDALVNIDLKTRLVKPQHTALNIVRVGTAGGLQADAPIDSFVVSEFGIGMDGLASFYQREISQTEHKITEAFCQQFQQYSFVSGTYVAAASENLKQLFSSSCQSGLTVTCSGFYAPQGRMLRGQPTIANFIEKLQQFNSGEKRILNFEMETAGIYAMGKILGHNCCSLSAIVANRIVKQFSQDPHHAVEKLIQLTLEKLS